MRAAVLALAALAMPAATYAQEHTELERGLAGALRGCEEWVLNPASWSDGPEPFLSAVGLGNSMGLVDTVDENLLPPEELRAANLYWRINSTRGAGFFLIVSSQLPICHITGGGDTDLQPVTEALLASNDFLQRWEEVSSNSGGDMASTTFRNLSEPAFSMVVSRARNSGQRLDRVQILATAKFDVGE